jgi:hypothetical protein
MNRFTTIRPTRASSASSCAAALLCSGLAGCVSYSPSAISVGDTQATVVQAMGQPTGRHALPNGQQRLEFARGPLGKHTYMVTVDAQARVAAIEQVLTEATFAGIQPGMPAAQVRSVLGQPSQLRIGWRGVGEVWSYRYEATFCQWFQVWLVDGTVREAAYAPDPLCDADDDKHARLR